MICFLTSRVDLPGGETLNPANHFIDEIRRFFPVRGRGLYICSDPDGWEKMDFYAGLTRAYFENSGFPFDRFLTLDSRNESLAEELIRESNVLILSGGHVPTQNRFFRKIDLRELLRSYSGLLFGISAGSMNSADIVYAQPELEGEATDPAYERFLPGLGLTKTMLLPFRGHHLFRQSGTHLLRPSGRQLSAPRPRRRGTAGRGLSDPGRADGANRRRGRLGTAQIIHRDKRRYGK